MKCPSHPLNWHGTSFETPCKRVALSSAQAGRIHPTQKPVALYAWIFQHYAKPGDRILDTHLGSGSSRIAAWDAGLDFIGYEIDPEYFEEQEKRFQQHTAQLSLFGGGGPDNNTDIFGRDAQRAREIKGGNHHEDQTHHRK